MMGCISLKCSLTSNSPYALVSAGLKEVAAWVTSTPATLQQMQVLSNAAKTAAIKTMRCMIWFVAAVLLPGSCGVDADPTRKQLKHT